jgi:hypothetical protein
MGMAMTFGEKVSEAGGDAAIFAWIARGDSVDTIMRTFGLRREAFYPWVNASPERKAAYAQAQRISADALADEAKQILDECPAETTAQVSKARAQSDIRMRLASVRSPDYRERTALDLTADISFGSAHLDALRLYGGPPKREALPVEIVEVGE